MATIQAAVGDTMIRPANDQVVYLDLSEPDSVVVYGRESAVQGLTGAVKSAGQVLDDIIENFR